jgi:deoxyribodipyrimidine photo-lyase
MVHQARAPRYTPRVRDLLPATPDPRVRVRSLAPPPVGARCVVYWMQRAQRGVDNPALDVAIDAGNRLGLPVAVHFGLHPGYPGANERHYAFLLDGLVETARRVVARGAAFAFRPYPDHSLLRFCREVRPALVVGDENPLRAPERWRARLAGTLKAPFWTVDADVIVPSALLEREEYAARTIRPKILRLLPRYLVRARNPRATVRWRRGAAPRTAPVEPHRLLAELPIDRSAAPVPGARGGTAAGRRRLRRFLTRGLARYHVDRNDPAVGGTSGLSGFLHFGHLGPLTVALAARRARAPRAAKQAFLEELIVRRELAVNFVTRNPRYDSIEGAPAWGRRTLREASRDPRAHTYDEAGLAAARTHDPLWNAAQREMMATGRMHGYLRMYWAKKILEWTASPEEAWGIALRLNDRYELDGRDPNGFAGVAWAIGGLHDRPWGPRRPVYGLIRYMSRSGAARKFDVDAYLERVARAEARAVIGPRSVPGSRARRSRAGGG